MVENVRRYIDRRRLRALGYGDAFRHHDTPTIETIVSGAAVILSERARVRTARRSVQWYSERFLMRSTGMGVAEGDAGVTQRSTRQ